MLKKNQKKIVLINCIILLSGMLNLIIAQDSIKKFIFELKSKASLVRINCIAVTNYSYNDTQGIKKTRNFFNGKVGSGVIINPQGFILTDKNTISLVLDFNSDYDLYLRNTEEIILTKIFETEKIEINNKENWKRKNSFRILNSILLKTILLANKTVSNFTIVSNQSKTEDQKNLFLLKIDMPNLPSTEVDIQTGDFYSDLLYYIAGSENENDLTKYFTNLDHNYLINKEYVPKFLSFDQKESITWERINNKITELYLDHSWFWFNAKGQLKAYIQYSKEEVNIITGKKIQDFLIQNQIDIQQKSNFNLEIENLIDGLLKQNTSQVKTALNRIEVYFYRFSEINQTKSLIFRELEKNPPKKSWLARIDFKDLFVKYKLYIIGTLSLILGLLIILIILKVKKRRKVIPDLPEEISEEEPDFVPSPPIFKKKQFNSSFDIFINGEFFMSHPLDTKSISIGRDPALVKVVISELIVSKIHCSIYEKDNEYYIKDEGSTNGVYDSNKKKITEKMLENNENIHLGKKGKIKIIFRKNKPDI